MVISMVDLEKHGSGVIDLGWFWNLFQMLKFWTIERNALNLISNPFSFSFEILNISDVLLHKFLC